MKKSIQQRAKIACGLIYAKINCHQKVVQFLFPVYEKLNSSDLTSLFESLYATAKHKECEQILNYAVARYPEMLGWKIKLVDFQINLQHLYPKDKDFILNNLKMIYSQCKSPQDYVCVAQIFYHAGYFKDAVNLFDISLQNLNVLASTKESFLFDSSSCFESMNEIIEILTQNKIKAFPAFGSLLGLVRDGKLMDYDKDADIGIITDNYDEIFGIVSTLCKLPKFTAPSMLNYSKNSHVWCIGIHDTSRNMVVDLFFFHKQNTHFEAGLYTNSGVLKWGFKPFELIQTSLANKTYWIPNNAEEHLTELYANWREPVEVWDSLLNCPNLIFSSQPVVIYYGLMRLWGALQDGKTKKALNYYETLTTRWGMHFSAEADANVRKLLGL